MEGKKKKETTNAHYNKAAEELFFKKKKTHTFPNGKLSLEKNTHRFCAEELCLGRGIRMDDS